MKVSGFTIVKNAIKYNYPVKEAILSILPVCDEFIINVNNSDNKTLGLIQSIGNPKIKIMQRDWDMSRGEKVLSDETNFALSQCTGDWAFYLQGDEVVHEKDLPRLKKLMQKYLNDENIDAFKFKWLHFYISYYRYRIDAGWFQKQNRIIRNNNTIEANSGAWGFQKKAGGEINTIKTSCYIYHYGWTNELGSLIDKISNAEKMGYASSDYEKLEEAFDLEKLSKFPVYFGTHPKTMKQRIKSHKISNQDLRRIKRKYFWNPLLWLKIRYKTPKRIRKALPK
jgi:hypothetical protein